MIRMQTFFPSRKVFPTVDKEGVEEQEIKVEEPTEQNLQVQGQKAEDFPEPKSQEQENQEEENGEWPEEPFLIL